MDWTTKRFPELASVSATMRKAALQAGYGAISARPVHFVSLLVVGFATAAGIAAGDAVGHGYVARMIGAAVGSVIGCAFYERRMADAMRPHVVRYLSTH